MLQFVIFNAFKYGSGEEMEAFLSRRTRNHIHWNFPFYSAPSTMLAIAMAGVCVAFSMTPLAGAPS
jgi:hypothetical protein